MRFKTTVMFPLSALVTMISRLFLMNNLQGNVSQSLVG